MRIVQSARCKNSVNISMPWFIDTYITFEDPDVSGLEVTVDNACAVQILQPSNQLVHNQPVDRKRGKNKVIGR